jgi:hypothetical protein
VHRPSPTMSPVASSTTTNTEPALFGHAGEDVSLLLAQ